MTGTNLDFSALAASYDIVSLGMHADDLRRRLCGTRTTFVRVADVPAEPEAPIAIPPAAGEVRIVGVPASRADAIARVAEVKPHTGGRALSGFSLDDLEALALREQVTLRSLLEDLFAAGLELVAEAPIDKLQDPRRAIEEVNIAGLALARLTVNQLPDVDLVSWLKQVAALQRDVAVIRSFAPLPRRINPAMPTTGYDDVKRVALARLVVDNIPSIQVDWSLYGPKLAQVALTVGADDIDAVSADDSQSEGRRRAPLEEIRRNITAAGFEPVERSGRYELTSR
jgi:aminodeoxyfutalosine synthase